VLVPYLAARIINFLEFLRVDDGILKIDALWDATVPAWLNWFIDIVPDSFWASLPEQVISLAFVSTHTHALARKPETLSL
jgi:hypothetical protein